MLLPTVDAALEAMSQGMCRACAGHQRPGFFRPNRTHTGRLRTRGDSQMRPQGARGLWEMAERERGNERPLKESRLKVTSQMESVP